MLAEPDDFLSLLAFIVGGTRERVSVAAEYPRHCLGSRIHTAQDNSGGGERNVSWRDGHLSHLTWGSMIKRLRREFRSLSVRRARRNAVRRAT